MTRYRWRVMALSEDLPHLDGLPAKEEQEVKAETVISAIQAAARRFEHATAGQVLLWRIEREELFERDEPFRLIEQEDVPIVYVEDVGTGNRVVFGATSEVPPGYGVEVRLGSRLAYIALDPVHVELAIESMQAWLQLWRRRQAR